MPTPNFDLPYLSVNQANKEIKHNQALAIIDVGMQLRVIDKDDAAPPGSPSDGDTYIVAPAATGLWTGQTFNLALWFDEIGEWIFITPKSGFRAYVIDEGIFYQFNGSDWVSGSFIIAGTTDAITASTTQTQVGATALLTQANRITTAANVGDSVRIDYAALPGVSVEITNSGANAIWIWPDTGDAIDGGVANARDANSLAAGSTRRYRSFSAGTWRTV